MGTRLRTVPRAPSSELRSKVIRGLCFPVLPPSRREYDPNEIDWHDIFFKDEEVVMKGRRIQRPVNRPPPRGDGIAHLSLRRTSLSRWTITPSPRPRVPTRGLFLSIAPARIQR